MHQMTLYVRRKLHLACLIAWEIRQKRSRHVFNSQSGCPNTYINIAEAGVAASGEAAAAPQNIYSFFPFFFFN